MSIIDYRARVATNSEPYTVMVKNRSNSQLYFICYQSIPNSNNNTLAWFAQPLAKETNGYFIWQKSYDMIWADTGPLKVGDIVRVGQTQPAQPNNHNETTLIRLNGAYQFGPTTDGIPNKLTITPDSTIPNDAVAIGIGMSQQPTTAIQASPNLQMVFTPAQPPIYTVAFSSSKIQKGQLIDTETLESSSCTINFPTNQFGAIVELTQGNTWKVSYEPTIDVK